MSNINTATARLLLLLAAIIQLTLSDSGADAQNNDIPWFMRQIDKLTCTSTADRWRPFVKANVNLKQAEMGKLYMNRLNTPCTTELRKASRNWDADFFYLGQCDDIIPKGMDIGCVKKSNTILQCFSNVVVRGYDGLLKKLRYDLKKCLAEYPHFEDSKQILSNVTTAHEDFMKTIKNDLERRYKLVANDAKNLPGF